MGLMQLGAAAIPAWAQKLSDLRKHIPKADPKKYLPVWDGSQWRNPYLLVRRDGVEIVGTMKAGQTIPIEAVPAALERLPLSAWPYGLIVGVSENAIVPLEEISDHREAKQQETLLILLKKMRVEVRLYPSG